MTDNARVGQCCEVTGIHAARQQLSLRFQVSGIGCGQPLLESWQIFQMTTNRYMVSVVQTRLSAQESVAFSYCLTNDVW